MVLVDSLFEKQSVAFFSHAREVHPRARLRCSSFFFSLLFLSLCWGVEEKKSVEFLIECGARPNINYFFYPPREAKNHPFIHHTIPISITVFFFKKSARDIRAAFALCVLAFFALI